MFLYIYQLVNYPILDIIGFLWNMISGARGRTRTGMELPPRDFLTRYNFRCCTASRRICGLDFLFAVPYASTG